MKHRRGELAGTHLGSLCGAAEKPTMGERRRVEKQTPRGSLSPRSVPHSFSGFFAINDTISFKKSQRARASKAEQLSSGACATGRLL